METVKTTNQGESSNESGVVKTNTQLPGVENRVGTESGLSDTAGRGAVSEVYQAPTGNDGINGTASSENLSAQYKSPRVQQDVGQYGDNQYE